MDTHHTTGRRRVGLVALVVALLLGTLAGASASPAGAQDPAPATGLTWKVSTNAFTSGSLSPAHANTAPATKTADGFVFPEATATAYDRATGAGTATFAGSFDLGNTNQGNYRIRLDTPVVTLAGDDTGSVSALVSYALFTDGAHVWSTPVRAEVATFTLPDGALVDTGTQVSFTVTPDFVPRTDLDPNPNGFRQFPQPFLDALSPQLISHFRETATGQAAAKAPAPLTISFPYGPPDVGLTWKMSTNAFTSSSLSPAHATTAPATKTADGFVFPETSTVGYDPETGAARVAFPGSFDLGNTNQGNYRIRVADPVVILDGEGAGRVDATVSYALFTDGAHVWSTPLPGTTIATFTLPEGQPVESGTNVSFTVTPDFVPRTDLDPNPNGFRQFPQPFLDALSPQLISHFRETATGQAAAKAPAPLTVTFEHAPATISVTGLDQAYDGTPRPVTVTTDPPGLATVVTYDGETAVPTDAGTYAVVVTLDEELAYGEDVTGTLTVAKGAQEITFAPLDDGVVGDDPVALAATASSGLAVAFTADGPCTLDGTEVTLDGPGECAVTASQAGDDNWAAATPVTHTFTVVGDDEAFVRRAYQVVLDRDGDAGGVAYWVEQMEHGYSRYDMTLHLVRGREGRERLVSETYARALGRPADAAGRTYWADRVDRGLTAEDLLATLLASPEALGRAGEGSVDAAELLYDVYLDRAGDEPGVAHWAARLEAASSAGARRVIALGFGRTGEATAVGVRTALVRACGSSAVGAPEVTAHWKVGHNPLLTAATALRVVCPV